MKQQTPIEKTYTNEERNAFTQLVRRQFKSKKFSTMTEFSEFSELGQVLVGRLMRTISDRTSFSSVIEFCLALDIDIYEVVRVLNLDKVVRERMEDPEYAGYFVNLGWMKGEGRAPTSGPLDELLKELPEEKRELGRQLIESTLYNLRQ